MSTNNNNLGVGVNPIDKDEIVNGIKDMYEVDFNHNFLPKDNLISIYANIFKGSPYPLEFFFTTFMTLILQLTNRNLIVNIDPLPIYPLIFVKIIARSGMGKSVPFQYIKMLIEKDKGKLFNIYSGFNSTEGLLAEMQIHNGKGLIMEDEYQRIYKKPSLEDLPDLENELYYAGAIYRIIKDDEKSIRMDETYTNIIKAITPTMFAKYADSDLVDSGNFQRETILYPKRFIKNENKGKKYYQDPDFLRVKDKLHAKFTFLNEIISIVGGKIEFELKIQDEIDLENFIEQTFLENNLDDDKLASIGKIKHKLVSYAISFFICSNEFESYIKEELENNDNNNSTFILPEIYLTYAEFFFENIIFEYAQKATKIVNERITFRPTGNQFDKVFEFIVLSGKEGRSLKEIGRKFRSYDHNKILTDLIEQEKIIATSIIGKGKKPTTIYYALKEGI